MAQKKFFVDINLQGNKLANSVVGANSSMTVGGSFQYAEGRLEYFDGATVQEVANLADISAVTGGLIFQGGYDPTTNTPDITDGTALKGFFWAAEAAGSFLGESVQVGDSIIAKVDNAGATIADWLILQGNVVIATDTVDGISRLATQAEANAGTEGGAVVITPATLQGKIDAQITPVLNDKLSKSGDTMSGNLDMGDNNINNINIANVTTVQATTVSVGDKVTSISVESSTVKTNILDDYSQGKIDVYTSLDFTNSDGTIKNLPAPTADGDAANKLYVDNASNDKLPLAGGTMSGGINMDGNSVYGAVNLSGQNLVVDTIEGNASGTVEFTSAELDFLNTAKVTNLPAPTNGGDAANKTYVDTAASTAESNANAYTDAGLAEKLDLAGGTMSGSINLDNYDLQNASLVNAKLGGTLDVQNQFVINLTDPTNAYDAAPKIYVDTAASTAQSNAEATASADATAKANAAQTAAEQYADSLAVNYDPAGSAATAESNANAYTNTQIDAQSFSTLIEGSAGTSGWTFDAILGVYKAEITHNLGALVTLSVFYDGAPSEFAGEYDNNVYYIYSNIEPVNNTVLNFIKAGGNL